MVSSDFHFRKCRGGDGHQYQSGVSLIMVLIMIAVIGIFSASAMRGAMSNDQATNSIRVQNLARQYAEAALRYCEGQLQAEDSTRTATLREGVLIQQQFDAIAGNSQGWAQANTWTDAVGSGGVANSRTVVPAGVVSSDVSSTLPAKMPECVAEKQYLTAGNADPDNAYVVTARGFSPDYSSNANGTTKSGSVVWLQSTISLR